MNKSDEIDQNQQLPPPIKKPITKLDWYQQISVLTGQDLVGYLCDLVDNEWSRLWKASFCTEQPLQYLPLFVIEVYPTQRQPGNGRVMIRTNNNKFVAYTYSTNPANGILNGILSPSFPEFWNKFITTPFGFSRLDMTYFFVRKKTYSHKIRFDKCVLINVY